MAENMDNSSDRCQRFYRFACGDFDNYVERDKSKSANEYLSIVEDKVQNQLKSAIENVTSEVPLSDKLVKEFYDICTEHGKKIVLLLLFCQNKKIEPISNGISIKQG